MKASLFVLLAACGAGMLQAQPMTIRAAGPVNSASQIPAGLPNSGVARGSIFVVAGTHLCAAGLTGVTAFPLETSMKGTTVQVKVGGQTVSAYLFYIYGGLKDADGNSFDQIAALLPSNTPAGDGTLVVSYNNQSVSTPVKILTSGPGIFSLTQTGHGPGVITDNVYWKLNTITNAFNDKTWVNIWATGLGPLPAGQADNLTPPVGNLNVNMEIYVGGTRVDPARIGYFGRAPGNAGLDQILFMPPAGIAGCSIPVYLKVGQFVSNNVTMSLGNATRCNDPLSATSSQMDKIERGEPLSIGKVLAVRADFKVQVSDASGKPKTAAGQADVGYARFARYDAAYAPFSQGVTGLPSLGNCLVMSAMTKKGGTLEQALNLTADSVPHTDLDAGANLSLSGPSGSRTMAAPAKPADIPPIQIPTTVEITFVNQGNDNAHIFIEFAECFPCGTKLARGATRVVTVPWVKGLVIPFVGGRSGVVLARGSVTLTESVAKVRVVFDESSTLKVTTTPPSGSTSTTLLGGFMGTVTSGYYKLLGADLSSIQLDPDAHIDPLFLNAGALTASTTGSADVGAMHAALQIPASTVDWPDKNTVDSITRSQGYQVRWTGGNPAVEHVAIYGSSTGPATGSDVPGTSFLCTAAAGDRQFTVPASVLQQLPASASSKDGIISIGTAPLNNAGPFTVQGVESGQFTFTQTVVRSVTYK